MERALVEAEGLVRDFSEDNPATRVTVLRFANVLGTHLTTPISRNLCTACLPVHLRVRPSAAVRRGGRRRPRPAARHPGAASPGSTTWPADGRLPWSEVASNLRDPARPALTLQPPEDPAPGAAVRPARGARGPPPLRTGRRHPAIRCHRFHLRRHQRGRRAVVHQGTPPTPAIGPAADCPTPTSTTWSSSSAIRRRSSAPTTI